MTQTPAAAAPPARALDPRFYRDAEIYAREMEHIFFRTWQYACHASALAEPGDYVAFRIADQGLFAIRSDDGNLRAFYNVCRHRAHELLTGSGNAPVICCPYHAWTYATDGRLRHARNTGKVVGFDIAQICLAEVRLELFHGFVFVNLDADAAPMAAWYPGAAEALGAFLPDIGRMKPVSEIAIEEPCNWMVTVENYSECYHCAIVHPTFARGVIDPKVYKVEVEGHCLHHSARAGSGRRHGVRHRRRRQPACRRLRFLVPVAVVLVPGLPERRAEQLSLAPDGTDRDDGLARLVYARRRAFRKSSRRSPSRTSRRRSPRTSRWSPRCNAAWRAAATRRARWSSIRPAASTASTRSTPSPAGCARR